MSDTIEEEPADQSPSAGKDLLDHREINRKKQQNKESGKLKGARRKVKSLFSSTFGKKKSSSSSYPFYYGDRPLGGCYLCLLPRTDNQGTVAKANVEDADDLDPSSYGYVKNLLERNDFFAPECNVHREN